MRQYTLSKRLYSIFLLAASILVSMSQFSCISDQTGEYTLSGNIEKYIPDNSYSIVRSTVNGSDGKQYLVVEPELNNNFSYWGLNIKKMEYFIDNKVVKIVESSPYQLMYNVDSLSIGLHNIEAKFTISGENCKDLVISKSDEFRVNEHGNISDNYGDFFINYNFISKGEYLKVTPYVNVSRSAEKCQIKEVTYYWDNNLIYTTSVSPFNLNYQVNDSTAHSLDVTIIYSDRYHSYSSCSWTYTNYQTIKDNDSRPIWNMKSLRVDYINGETVSSVANVYNGKQSTRQYVFELSFDGKLIGKTSTFPYTNDFKLENQALGYHTFTEKWTCNDGNASMSYTKIFVTP
jgi:hypothetical protein